METLSSFGHGKATGPLEKESAAGHKIDLCYFLWFSSQKDAYGSPAQKQQLFPCQGQLAHPYSILHQQHLQDQSTGQSQILAAPEYSNPLEYIHL